MPKDVVDKLASELTKVLAQSDVRATRLSSTPVTWVQKLRVKIVEL